MQQALNTLPVPDGLQQSDRSNHQRIGVKAQLLFRPGGVGAAGCEPIDIHPAIDSVYVLQPRDRKQQIIVFFAFRQGKYAIGQLVKDLFQNQKSLDVDNPKCP